MPGAEEGAESPRRHPHLVQLLDVGAEPRARVVREDARGLLAQAGAERRRRGSVLGRLGHIRHGSRGRAPGRPSACSRRRRRPARRSAFSIRRSVFSSPSSSSTSSSSKLRVTRWWSSTATVSWTISAPSARTPSRRVRRRAIGFSRAPLRCPARSASRSAGGAAGRAGLSPARAAPSPPAASAARGPCRSRARWRSVTPRRASRWSSGVVVGRDEEPRLDRLAAELGQREVLAGAKLHLSLDGSRGSPSAESRRRAW